MAPLIRHETPADAAAIRRVNLAAFGQDGEGKLVAALRAGGHVRLSLVAEVDGQIVGHILFSHLPIVSQSNTTPALALAPMAVVPTHQRQGIGTALVRRALDECRDRGHTIVVVVGHPDFYPRFGFSAKLGRQLQTPYPGDSFMALELLPGAMAGVTGEVRYAPPFSEL